MAGINVFKIKEWAAFIIVGMVPTVVFAGVLLYYGFLFALIFYFVFLLLMVWVGKRLISNPFSDMLKGKGLLTLNLDSTGVISAFISHIGKGVMGGWFNGSRTSDAFDRDNVVNMNAPKSVKGSFERNDEEACYELRITDRELYDARFAFNQYPVLIYNEATASYITKNQFSNLEKNLIAHNKLVFLSRKVETLSDAMLNFGRYIVDNLKPKNRGGGMPNWVMILVIIAAIVLLGVLIWKGVAGGALSGALDSAKSAVGNVAPSGNPITPMG